MSTVSSLGDRVRALRLARGLRQEDLARLSGIEQGSISHIERGLRDEIKGTHLLLMARALETTAEHLLFGDDADPVAERTLLGAFRAADDSGRETLLRVAQALASSTPRKTS